jgi:signal peptidase I
VPGQHEYFVVNSKLYQIGSNDDMPRGMGGRYYVIQFEDGTVQNTRSLWVIGDVPESKRKIFKQNARFIQKGEYGNYD